MEGEDTTVFVPSEHDGNLLGYPLILLANYNRNHFPFT